MKTANRAWGRASGLRIRLFGTLAVSADDRPLRLGAPKTAALLCFVLLHDRHGASRDRIASALWPDAPDATSMLRRLVLGTASVLGLCVCTVPH